MLLVPTADYTTSNAVCTGEYPLDNRQGTAVTSVEIVFWQSVLAAW